MKKFEVTFEGKLYDYITQKMMLEYMNSFFPRAEVNVKTIGRKRPPSMKRGFIYMKNQGEKTYVKKGIRDPA